MPEQKFQQLSTPVVDVYLSIEEQMLINIARRLKKHRSLLKEDVQEWQLEQLNEQATLTQENIRTIAKYAQMSVDEVTDMLQKAGFETVEKREGTMQAAVAAGALSQAPSIHESPALEAILSTYQEQAKRTFNLVNATMLEQSHHAHVDILNRVAGKVLAGVQTPEEALREVAREWAENGIPALIDSAGKRWTTEAYVNLVMRSMCNNIANEMQDRRMQEYGVDLIEVSSHMGARPKCAPYQGRVFSLSGTHKTYPAFRTTSYGLPDGLFGINCRHVKYPFIPGISKQVYQQYDQEANQQTYEESQRQRTLERRIRKAKRELYMMQAMGDEEGIQAAKRKVSDRQSNMRQFIRETDRTRQYSREQVH